MSTLIVKAVEKSANNRYQSIKAVKIPANNEKRGEKDEKGKIRDRRHNRYFTGSRIRIWDVDTIHHGLFVVSGDWLYQRFFKTTIYTVATWDSILYYNHGTDLLLSAHP